MEVILYAFAFQNAQERRAVDDSLYGVLNQTTTRVGARALRHRLLHPLMDPKEINHRLNLVQFFRERFQAEGGTRWT